MGLVVCSSIRDGWPGLVKKGHRVNFRKGQVLFYQGHEPYGLFVVLEGKVRFERGVKACDGEHTWHTPEGEVLGLLNLLSGRPFCCTCKAASPCGVLFISRSAVDSLRQSEGTTSSATSASL